MTFQATSASPVTEEAPRASTAAEVPQVPTSILKRQTPLWKRMMDLLLTALLLPLLLPLFLIVGCYIKLVSPGPILFKQKRLGRGGEYFSIFKFRTMHVAPEGRDDTHRAYVASLATGPGPIAKPDYQSSLIPGGDLLRKLSVDELPQLVNVLQGSMSLVGPRPDVLHAVDYAPDQLRRFEVVPGMTGLWQVSGKNRLSFDEMIELDIRYIETLSPSRDAWIIAKTFKVLLLERNE